MENICPLYFLLKDFDFVENIKEYTHLIYNRQIKIDDEIIEDPKYVINKTPKKLQVGLRVVNI